MVTRRELLGATAAGVTVGAAGCSAIPFLGNEPLEFEATRATVPASTREETGYEEKEVAQDVIERTFEVAGQSQDVVVTNWQAECDKAIDVGDLVEQDLPADESARAAIFTVLSTPQVSVLGRSFNPVEDMDSRELAQQVQDNYDGMEDIEQVGEDGTLVAGQETTAGEFSTEAQLAETDRTVELAMHITEAVEVGEDFVVAVGAYPRPVREVERDNVFAMMEAVEHEGGE